VFRDEAAGKVNPYYQKIYRVMKKCDALHSLTQAKLDAETLKKVAGLDVLSRPLSPVGSGGASYTKWRVSLPVLGNLFSLI